MLICHQAIYLDTMDNHLICPMQCRVQGVTIHDTPKIFVNNPTNHSHAIVVLDPVDPKNNLVIPLELVGVTSVFSLRIPIHQEFKDDDNPQTLMTQEAPDWDPHNSDWSQQKASMTDLRGHLQGFNYDVIARGQQLINSESCIICSSIQQTVRTLQMLWNGVLKSVGPRLSGGREQLMQTP